MKTWMYTGALCLALVGCAANPPVTSLSPDTYMITRIDKGGIFGNAAAMKADVIGEANEFAAKQGKVAVPLVIHETPLRGCPACWASIEYQFRVVEPSDPEVRRTSLVPVAPRSEVIIDDRTAPNGQPPLPPAKDLYSEMLKLDDLRKRGLLTDAEFEAQKTRLLQGR
ncbi:SHOCT domain-containing protein [Ramlibacter ginsenosidimutans]|uniref:SHOCT domain-containing protein n=1 Tax=Ramlibacter ginsenosidimutans TaxID=502333 RepID=A0A934WN51_9BURK|nr:SHOCT domain-containing protein [Ramlibacter ginsenosidimutans]MBK6006872.1 SHOCT domain-containing protein [Ramlibacter ginsenosidimutans]